MKERESSGVEGLDRLLGGGFRPGTSTIVQGASIGGRELLLRAYFAAGLKEGEGCLYVSTRNFATEVIAEFTGAGIDLPALGGRYRFIDTYAAQADPAVQDTDAICYVSSIADFAKMSNAIMTSLGEFISAGVSGIRLAFDSIDTMLLYVSPQGVYRFLSYLRAKIKVQRATAMFLIEPTIHNEKDLKTMLQLADVIMEVDLEKGTVSVQQGGTPKVSGKFSTGARGAVVD